MSNRLKRIQQITLSFLATILMINILPVSRVAGANDGGYPWADAVPVHPNQYDWGYIVCQPAMRRAKMCSAHYAVRAGVRYHLSDPWHYDVRNCTSYVAWRVNQEHGFTIARWGDAKNWLVAAQHLGYVVNHNPSIGSIAWWSGRKGHVAYVTDVDSRGLVSVDQYNRRGRGEFSHQIKQRADFYIHLPALNQARKVTPSQPTAVASTQKQTTELPTVSPLLPLGPGTIDQPLPSRPGVKMSLAVDPLRQQVNVYAVQDQLTKSGQIEVSKSNGNDGNTTWQSTWQTDLPVIKPGLDQDYSLVDANHDNKLDLYIITHNPGAVKITVLDGSRDFRTTQNTWNVETPVDSPDAYALTDFDHNGSQDLVSIKSRPDKLLNVTILNGSTGYDVVLLNVDKPAAKSVTSPRYTIGDYNRDGLIDVYQLGSEPNQPGLLQVNVLDLRDNHTGVSWQTV